MTLPAPRLCHGTYKPEEHRERPFYGNQHKTVTHPSRSAKGNEMITTTLNKIREHEPCINGWKKLLAHLGKTEADDEPLPFAIILESNGLDDTLWCCRSAPEYDKEWRLFAVWCARQVQHLMEDSRSLNALDVAERFANGLATEDELKAARSAAKAAWDAAGGAAGAAAGDAAGDAAWSAAWDAWAAWAAAKAAWSAAGDAWFAAWDAADAADAAWDAARDAAGYAARDAAEAAAGAAAKEKQSQEFLRIVEGK